jgi:hypothetical protein
MVFVTPVEALAYVAERNLIKRHPETGNCGWDVPRHKLAPRVADAQAIFTAEWGGARFASFAERGMAYRDGTHFRPTFRWLLQEHDWAMFSGVLDGTAVPRMFDPPRAVTGERKPHVR